MYEMITYNKMIISSIFQQGNELLRKPVTVVVAAKVRAPDWAIFQPGTLKTLSVGESRTAGKRNKERAYEPQTNFNVPVVSLTVGAGGGMQKSGTSGEHFRA